MEVLMGKYRFVVGQKVRIRTSEYASIACKKHAGEIVTIKSRCEFTYAYELEELDDLWMDGCFEAI
jgi:hypothetical protein